jgi:hypothetical protein
LTLCKKGLLVPFSGADETGMTIIISAFKKQKKSAYPQIKNAIIPFW